MALAIDGSVHKNLGSSSSTTVSLTTTQPNDYIIVVVETNGGPGLSVSSAAVGSFTRLGRAGSAGLPLEIWAAFSSAALTADTITVTTTNPNFLTIDAFGVSGSGQTSLVFDSGGPQTASTDPVSITTVNANTMVIAAFRDNSTPTPTAGAGFTAVSGANFLLTEYKILSAPATTSCTQTTGAGDSNGVVVIAIVQAAATTTNGARVLQRFNRSKLAYPAGSTPGFDPSHPASQNLAGTHGFSAVAIANGFTNLITGTTASLALGASGASMIINRNGPTFNWPVSTTGQNAKFPALQVSENRATLAIIGTYSSAASGAFIFTDTSNGRGFRLEGTGFTMPAVVAVPHGLTFPTNVPVFYAASKTPTAVNFVILNLATGALLTSTVADANSQTAGGVAFSGIGSDAASALGTPIASVAAAMWAPVGLSMPQLLRWAADPWSFWFPNKMLNLMTDSGVTPTAIQYAAFSIPQHDGQSITQMMGY